MNIRLSNEHQNIRWISDEQQRVRWTLKIMAKFFRATTFCSRSSINWQNQLALHSVAIQAVNFSAHYFHHYFLPVFPRCLLFSWKESSNKKIFSKIWQECPKTQWAPAYHFEICRRWGVPGCVALQAVSECPHVLLGWYYHRLSTYDHLQLALENKL